MGAVLPSSSAAALAFKSANAITGSTGVFGDTLQNDNVQRLIAGVTTLPSRTQFPRQPLRREARLLFAFARGFVAVTSSSDRGQNEQGRTNGTRSRGAVGSARQCERLVVPKSW
jgi:hypothetical protein